MTRTLGGTYRILERIGSGGMGEVYRGIDLMLEREVAIKALHPGLASNPRLVQRFRSEAILLARLNHPNIAAVYNFLNQDDTYYMIMEYVRGRTFEHILQSTGPLKAEYIVPLVNQALVGIEHAHRSGIIHRDIKPANLMLADSGVVKVMDFGIARALGTDRLTRTGTLVGSFHYMSPEQIRGKETDARSDVYSLGIVLYEMTTGRVPFEGENEYDLMSAHLNQVPESPRHLAPDLPDFVVRAIEKALAKNPDERFQNAGQFRIELQRTVSRGSVPMPPAPTRLAEPEASLPEVTADLDVIEEKPEGPSFGIHAEGDPDVEPLHERETAEINLPFQTISESTESKLTRYAAPGHFPSPTRIVNRNNVLYPDPKSTSFEGNVVPAGAVADKTIHRLMAGFDETRRFRPVPFYSTILMVVVLCVSVVVTSTLWIEDKMPQTTAARDTLTVDPAETPKASGFTTNLADVLTRPQPSTPEDLRRPEHLEGILEEKKNPDPAENTGQKTAQKPVEKKVEPVSRSGTLRILPRPFGDIYVNGEKKAEGKIVWEGQLPAGEYRVRVVHPVYGAWEQTLNVGPGTTEQVINLGIVYSVMVGSKPAAAHILIDGEDSGKRTPSTVRLRPGKHRIEVKKDGYVLKGKVRTVHVNEAGSDTLFFELNKP